MTKEWIQNIQWPSYSILTSTQKFMIIAITNNLDHWHMFLNIQYGHSNLRRQPAYSFCPAWVKSYESLGRFPHWCIFSPILSISPIMKKYCERHLYTQRKTILLIYHKFLIVRIYYDFIIRNFRESFLPFQIFSNKSICTICLCIITTYLYLSWQTHPRFLTNSDNSTFSPRSENEILN